MTTPFKPMRHLEAENAALRQQLNVLYRRMKARPRLKNSDRCFFVLLYRLFQSFLNAMRIIQSETQVRWHRSGFLFHWRWKSRHRVGRPKIDVELSELMKRMNEENPLWGAPRIHGEILKLGFDIAQSTVAKYMSKRRNRPPGQGWRTFLCNHLPETAAMDFFVVPTLGFELLYAFVVIHLDRRLIVFSNVTRHPTAQWVARQITEAFPWDQAPHYIIRDRDGLYDDLVKKRLKAMGIRDRPTAPRSPWQNAYIERLIRSIRRECVDHCIIVNETHLRRILRKYTKILQ